MTDAPVPVDSSASAMTIVSQRPTFAIRGFVRALVFWSLGIYTALILGVMILNRWLGEWCWWWCPTAFWPRIVWAIPMAPLAFALKRANAARDLWCVWWVTLILIFGPLMGFQWQWPEIRSRAGSLRFGTPENKTAPVVIRVLTLNRWDRGYDAIPLITLLEQRGVDVVCFQEGVRDPLLESFFRDWHHDPSGQIYSRRPIVRHWPAREPPLFLHGVGPSLLRKVKIRHESGAEFQVVNVHLPSIREGLKAWLRGDWDTLRKVISWREVQFPYLLHGIAEMESGPIVIAGDFNTPHDSPTFHVLRSRFQSGWESCGWGYGYTFPHPVPFLRLDQIFASPHWRFRDISVGPWIGSDHLPVIATLELLTDS